MTDERHSWIGHETALRRETADGWIYQNVQNQALAVYLALKSACLPALDEFIEGLEREGVGAGQELRERRTGALQEWARNNYDGLARHIEWIIARKMEITRDNLSRESRQVGAGMTNAEYAKSNTFCVEKATKIWADNPSMRMAEMLEQLESLLISEKMKAPTKAVIKGYLKKAQKEGRLAIPQDAQKPGRPKKSL